MLRRRRYLPPRRSRLQVLADHHKLRFASLIPIMEKFAREYGMDIQLDIPQNSLAAPQCLIKWRNRHMIQANLTLTGSPGNMHLKAICWNAHRTLGIRDWWSYALDAGRDLRAILHEARIWAESVNGLE